MVPSPPGLTGDGLLLCLQPRIHQSPCTGERIHFVKIPVPLYHLPEEPTEAPHQDPIWIPPWVLRMEPHYGTDAKLADVLSCSVISDSLQLYGL